MKKRNFLRGKLFENRGQMLLVVVLTMIIALTVGLSVVSRTITGLRISKQNEESQRAFQAAEAGIEKAIQSGTSDNSSFDFPNNSNYSTSVLSSLTSGTNFLLNGGEAVTQDSGIDVWLATYPTYASPYSGNVTLYWNPDTKTSCSPGNGAKTAAAIEVDVISGTLGVIPATPTPTRIPTPTPTAAPVQLDLVDVYDGTANPNTCITGDDNPKTRSVGGTSSFKNRAFFKYSFDSVPQNSTILSAQLRYYVESAGASGIALAAYNGTGSSDPLSSSCSTIYTRSKPSSSYTTSSVVSQSGQHAYNFNSSQIDDVQDALDNGSFTVAFNEGNPSGSTIGTITDRHGAISRRSVLRITYRPSSGPTPSPTRTPTPSPIPAPNLTVTKYVFDPCSGRTSGASDTSGAGSAGGITTFRNSAAISLTSGLIAKVVPLYGSTIVGVTSAGLPSQGKVIDSTGTSQETVRKIRYFTSNPQIPFEIFPYSILSQ